MSILKKRQKFYNWHAGAPNDIDFNITQKILLQKLEKLSQKFQVKKFKFTDITKMEIKKLLKYTDR